MKTSLYSIFKD